MNTKKFEVQKKNPIFQHYLDPNKLSAIGHLASHDLIKITAVVSECNRNQKVPFYQQ